MKKFFNRYHHYCINQRHLLRKNARLRFYVCLFLLMTILTQLLTFFASPLSAKFGRIKKLTSKSALFYNLQNQSGFLLKKRELEKISTASNFLFSSRFSASKSSTLIFFDQFKKLKNVLPAAKRNENLATNATKSLTFVSSKMNQSNRTQTMENLLNCSFIHLKSTTSSLSNLPEAYRKNREVPHDFPICGGREMLDPWFYHTGVKFGMLFLVKADPKKIKLRHLIRSGWGKISSLRGMKFATIFIMGRTLSVNEQRLLEEENKIFGDILQCEFLDTYRNLPVKVLSSFRWILSGHISSHFYTYTDDDCVMDISRITTFFRIHRNEHAMFCGFVYDKNGKPLRNPASKWFVNNSTYPSSHYPTFCHGGMWTLQEKLVHDLYCAAQLTDRGMFHLEDVYITGILRQKLGEGNRNIFPVRTKSLLKYEMMYYPWGDGKKAEKKVALKWKKFNKTLPWEVGLESGIMTVYTRNTFDDFIELLKEKWDLIHEDSSIS